jgi:uncharacterized integral membrane protein
MSFIRSLGRKTLFFLILLFFVLIAIFNYSVVEINFFGLKKLDIPLFLVIFGSFLLGSVFNILYFMFHKK